MRSLIRLFKRSTLVLGFCVMSACIAHAQYEMDFGEVQIGHSASRTSYWHCPMGNCWQITSYEVQGSNADEFTVVSGCGAGSGYPCFYTVTFIPKPPAGLKSALILWRGPDAGQTVYTTLTASALAGIEIESFTLNTTTVTGGSAAPAGVVGTLKLSEPAPAAGVNVVVITSTLWGVLDLPAPEVARVSNPVTILGGQVSISFPIETTTVLFPIAVNLRASTNTGSQKSAMLTVMPNTIPEIGSLANQRVRSILDYFFEGQFATSYSSAIYRHVLTERLMLVRNETRNPEALNDIYLAAADHYLFAATMLSWAPPNVKLELLGAQILILAGYEYWKHVFQSLDPETQEWISANLPRLDPRTTDRPASPASMLSFQWGLRGLLAGLLLN